MGKSKGKKGLISKTIIGDIITNIPQSIVFARTGEKP